MAKPPLMKKSVLKNCVESFSSNIRNKTKTPTLITFIQDSTEILVRTIRPKKEMKDIQIENE